MSTLPKPQKRWMASALKTSAQPLPALPFKRGNRRATTAVQPPRLLRSA
ncbi:hypothetical protein [Pelagivirga sediminicola]|nr:hypothetical protein [Pelagivirga sediminicola]